MNDAIKLLVALVVVMMVFIGGKRAPRWAQRLLLTDIIQGLKATLAVFWQKKSTVQYPEEQLPRSVRNRGLLALRRYPNGEERCIACGLCSATCPALAITIESEPRSDGSRRAKRFDIDMFKCINCGMCEEACPVDAIVLTSHIHYAVTERGQNILTKEKLLTLGEASEAQLAKDREDDAPYR